MPNPNAPIYLVLAEVRFSPVLTLEGYVPAIQEKLRRNGFPDFQRRVSQQLVFSTQPNADSTQVAPNFASQTSYVFADIERQQIITLGTGSLSFQTSGYENFQTFSQAFLEILGFIHEIISIDFFEHVGIRYLDAIKPNQANHFGEDLVPEAFGISHFMEGKLRHSYSETLLEDGFERIFARVYIQNGILAIPADLFGFTPQFPQRFSSINGLHAILDNDAAYTRREIFSLEKIADILGRIKARTSGSFKKMVTPAALQKWGIV